MASAQTQVQILRKLQTDFNAAIDSHSASSEKVKTDEVASSAVSKVAHEVLATVEDPIEQLLKIGFQVSRRSGGHFGLWTLIAGKETQNLAMRISIDLDLFTIIEERTSLDELVKKTGAERILLCICSNPWIRRWS
jgi:hypothetical protein